MKVAVSRMPSTCGDVNADQLQPQSEQTSTRRSAVVKIGCAICEGDYGGASTHSIA